MYMAWNTFFVFLSFGYFEDVFYTGDHAFCPFTLSWTRYYLFFPVLFVSFFNSRSQKFVNIAHISFSLFILLSFACLCIYMYMCAYICMCIYNPVPWVGLNFWAAGKISVHSCEYSYLSGSFLSFMILSWVVSGMTEKRSHFSFL